jgi:Kef-type K+ transport system membrane component KefB
MALNLDAQIMLVIGICLISSFVINLFSKRLKLPMMIAPLLVGLALNHFKSITGLFPDFRLVLEVLSGLGIIMVLFFIGLKVDLHFMKGLSKNSTIMALNAGHVPFILGLFATYIFTRNWLEAVFVGIALAITAEEVSVSILEEMHLLQKRIGQLIIDAGIIGDIFEISAIALLGLFIRSKEIADFSAVALVLEIILFLVLIILMRYYGIGLLFKTIGKTEKKFEYFSVAIVTLLIIVGAAEALNFSGIIGALLAGLLLKDKLIKDKLYIEEHHIVESLEVFNFGIFHPLVFVWIGLSVDLAQMSPSLGLGLVLTVLALAGKILGSMLGNMFCKESYSEGFLIGWGLNARGATEMFALLIAKNQGFISDGVFSAVVLMALLTTIISPIVFKILVLKGIGLDGSHKTRKHVPLAPSAGN